MACCDRALSIQDRVEPETYVARLVRENLDFDFTFKGKKWSLLSSSDLGNIYDDVVFRVRDLCHKMSNEQLRVKAGKCEKKSRFNVATGEGLRMTGLTKLYYDHTKVNKTGTLWSMFAPAVSTSDDTAGDMLYLYSLPSDDEFRKAFGVKDTD